MTIGCIRKKGVRLDETLPWKPTPSDVQECKNENSPKNKW